MGAGLWIVLAGMLQDPSLKPTTFPMTMQPSTGGSWRGLETAGGIVIGASAAMVVAGIVALVASHTKVELHPTGTKSAER